ncbi:hypothetical protein HOLleu_23145 [Holothuria leucospilota]|uniref:arylamine N-acetyltransferase n=1 Tax=Holothuria leucospilota TaxID=206669 RepID=A0A9Q1BUS5_HOLLE|nr:hypothetical protein HOLleu_23145 [Holothuria leucospilota]
MSSLTDTEDASLRRLSQMLRMTSATENGRDSQIQIPSSLNKEESNVPNEVTSEVMELPYPLTKEEAIDFVENNLNIPDSEVFFQNNKLGFLNQIVERMNQVIPYTNMHFFTSVPVWNLTGEDCKTHILSGQGGTCIWINPFTKALLEKIGYDAHLVCGNNPGDTRNDTHISTIVSNISYPGSGHLADPGTRRPLCAAIPLDFEKESPVYKFHYMRSKFFWRESAILIWCAQSPQRVPESQVIYDANGEKWQIQVTYWLNEKTSWYSYVRFWQTFGKESPLTFRHPFHGLVFVAYLNNTDTIASILGYKNKVVVMYHGKDSYKKVSISRTELMNLFQDQFPQYPTKLLQEVFKNCQLE